MKRERGRVRDESKMKIRLTENRMEIRSLYLKFHFQVTHNPKAIKLHTSLVEILDFLKPPFCCCIAKEVRECGVSPVELNMRQS